MQRREELGSCVGTSAGITSLASDGPFGEALPLLQKVLGEGHGVGGCTLGGSLMQFANCVFVC